MGNSNSSQRDSQPRNDRRFHELVQPQTESIRSRSPIGNGNGRNSRLSRSHPPTTQLRDPDRRHSNIYGTFRRQMAARSVPMPPASRHDVSSDQIAYEQEERPLVNMEDVPVTHITAGPNLLRRQSTMSRLGNRLLPDPVLRGLLSSGEETPAEGRALRHGTSAARPSSSVWERRLPQSTSRISLRESLRHRTITRTDTRQSLTRGPFSIDEPENTMPSELSAGQDTEARHLSEDDDSTPRPALWRTRTRLHRFRNSLSIPFLGSSQDRTQLGQASRQMPRRPSRVTFADDSDHLLPPLSTMDHRLDMDDSPHELDAVEPETRNVLSPSRITQGMSTIRRFPHGLRSRSTRLIRRGEHPPLSQVLQLAAAAIAAQLSGHAHGGAGVRPLAGGDAFDGSIQNFVQTLQEAASAQAGENVDLNASDGDLPPVNFMRVFQFPNDENGAPITSQPQMRTLGTEAMDLDSNGDSDRSVTLVLVGVRSMPHGQDGTGENAGPSLDTLLSLPFLPPTNMMRNGSSGALFRRSDGRSRTSSRRHSMTNFNFPAQYESQRHQRTRATTNRGSSERGNLTPSNTTNNIPSIISESPPGPRPPPSTPADMRSGTATPDRRPSSASAAQPPLTSAESSGAEAAPSGAQTESPFNTARQRRRSDSEFARRPELSSGAARRNGVVEPDNPPPGGRSWLIYVVG